MTDLDNQQATSSWFIGILDGEGSFRNTKKSNIEVRISNTDIDIIEKCEEFLRINNIYFSTYHNKRSNRKIEYTISVRNSRNMFYNYPKNLYQILEKKLECRRDEYQQILGASETECDLSVDLNWFVGVFEAEGSFSLVMNNRGRATIKLEISNTRYKIIEKAAKTLHSLGCSYHIMAKNRYKDHYKIPKSIEIYGMKRSFRLLQVCRNLWISSRNKKRSSLLLEFIESRLPTNQKEPYTERQLQIIQTMKDLNR